MKLKLKWPKKALQLFLWLVLTATAIRPLAALNPRLSATQYLHTRWTQPGGFELPAVHALAQTTDGYLWVGTANGLFRFDGIRFAAWNTTPGDPLAGKEIRALQAASDGSLWIATADSVSHIQTGQERHYTRGDGLPEGAILSMLLDRSGRLWLGAAVSKASSLAVIDQGVVSRLGSDRGLPESISALWEDAAGTIWAGGGNRLCAAQAAKPASCLPNLPMKIVSITGAPDGSLVLASSGTPTLMRVQGGRFSALPVAAGASLPAWTLFRDRDGNLWMGTLGRGLLRLREGSSEQFSRREGMSSDLIYALFEDREGDLWVGTANGLDRFRNPRIARITTLEGLSGDLVTAVCAGRDGSTWIGTAGGGLNRSRNNSITHDFMRLGLPNSTILSLHEDSTGKLWAGTPDGVVYWDGGRFVPVPMNDGTGANRVFQIESDAGGRIWFADADKGLLTVRQNRLQAAWPSGLTGLPEKPDIYQIHADRQGTLWIGFFHGGLAAVRNGAVTSYVPGQDVAAGSVRSIYESPSGTIWIGTGGGLSRFRDGQWTTWTKNDGLPEGIQGIIGDGHGSLWLITSDGIGQIAEAEFQAHRGNLRVSQYGLKDGIRLDAGGQMTNPRLTMSRDGILWISTKDGVAVIDPLHLQKAPIPPAAVIEQLQVDGKRLDFGRQQEIVLRGREIQIDYTGLSLAAPESSRFRYRLEGLNSEWVDGGYRRSIVYANLPAGPYRFILMASNDDGIWNETPAILPFRVLPVFYRTWWFVALCAVMLCLAVWGASRLRDRQVRKRFQLVLQERARLTRELHDTLLQGFAGVVYQLHAASRQFDQSPELSRQKVERALEQADQALQEARQTLSLMRLSALEHQTLGEALTAAGKQLTEGMPMVFELNVKGTVRALPYDKIANLYALTREAINNAVNHAQPSRISVELAYSPQSLLVTVSDDGVGFDLEQAEAKRDHWGLRGMRERATSIGGAFTIHTQPGAGCRIAVNLPHRRAQAAAE